MVATCRCGIIVDGGPSGVVAKDLSEVPGVLWAEYAMLAQSMVLHMRGFHGTTIPVDAMGLWAISVECARYFTSSDEKFDTLRDANREGLIKRIGLAPATALIAIDETTSEVMSG